METTPRFIQGIFAFQGAGLNRPAPLDGKPAYTVPFDRRAQLIYLRAGNSTDVLVTLALLSNGKPIRYFPVGAKASVHVPLAGVEDLFPETRLEVVLAAPEGVAGTVVLDVGLMEI